MKGIHGDFICLGQRGGVLALKLQRFADGVDSAAMRVAAMGGIAGGGRSGSAGAGNGAGASNGARVGMVGAGVAGFGARYATGGMANGAAVPGTAGFAPLYANGGENGGTTGGTAMGGNAGGGMGYNARLGASADGGMGYNAGAGVSGDGNSAGNNAVAGNGARPGASGAETGENAPSERTNETGAASDAHGPADLNALLSGDAALQSQFDRLVGKALATARGKWERERGMSAEDLAAERVREREEGLDSRERDLTRRELRASALAALGERGLPASLIGCVALESEKDMRASLIEAERAFRQSVDAAVENQMRGAAPKGGGENGSVWLAQARRAAGLS